MSIYLVRYLVCLKSHLKGLTNQVSRAGRTFRLYKIKEPPQGARRVGRLNLEGRRVSSFLSYSGYLGKRVSVELTTGRISPSTLFIYFLIVSDYFTVVQRSPIGVSSRMRLDPLGFSTIFCTVPVTPDFRVVNCEPTVIFSILLPFGCLISLTLSQSGYRVKSYTPTVIKLLPRCLIKECGVFIRRNI